MAGLIRVNENKAWSAAGWVYDHVLRQSVPYVPADSRRLLSVLKNGMVEGLSHIDLSALSPTDKRIFLRALKEGFRHTEEGGSSAFAEPEFYPGFIDRFKELIDMLSADLKESDENVRNNNNGET
jgi:hypothetical protein